VKPEADPSDVRVPTAAEQEDSAQAAFTEKARGLLLDSVDSIDGHTRSRLTQARHAAINELARPRQSPFLPMRWLAPAGSFAAIALVAFIWLGVGTPGMPDAGTGSGVSFVANSPIDDIEILATAENLELFEEMEFYEWLEAEAALTASPAGGAG